MNRKKKYLFRCARISMLHLVRNKTKKAYTYRHARQPTCNVIDSIHNVHLYIDFNLIYFFCTYVRAISFDEWRFCHRLHRQHHIPFVFSISQTINISFAHILFCVVNWMNSRLAAAGLCMHSRPEIVWTSKIN